VVAAKSILDRRVDLLKRGVEVDRLLRQVGDKVGGQLLAGHHRVLGVGSRDRGGCYVGGLAQAFLLRSRRCQGCGSFDTESS
jgi:hypothetical protein